MHLMLLGSWLASCLSVLLCNVPQGQVFRPQAAPSFSLFSDFHSLQALFCSFCTGHTPNLSCVQFDHFITDNSARKQWLNTGRILCAFC
jgi:hypothetical protein